MNLGTTGAQASPIVESVTVTFSYQPASVRLVSFRAAERQPLWQSGWRWLLAHLSR
jgi:hypothetical protein